MFMNKIVALSIEIFVYNECISTAILHQFNQPNWRDTKPEEKLQGLEKSVWMMWNYEWNTEIFQK